MAAQLERKVNSDGDVDLLQQVFTLPAELAEPSPRNEQESRINGRCVSMSLFGVVCVATTIGLITLSIMKDYGNSYNALITVGTGFAFQYAVQVTPFRNFINFEKNILTDYSAEFFLAFTQLYLNVPQPRWFVRTTFGMFNALLGAQIATKIDTIVHWKLRDDRSAESDVLIQDPRTIHMISGNHSPSRRVTEVAKVIIAIVGLILSSIYPSKMAVIRKLGWLLLGHSIGSGIHETIHSFRRHFEKQHEEMQGLHDGLLTQEMRTPKTITYLRLLEKVEQVVGVFLPGIIIAFNTSPTDCLSGVCMGMIRHIDWIRYTKTPVQELGELKKADIPQPAYLKVVDVAKYLFAVGVAAFVAVAMVQGTAVDRWALATFAVMLYSSYAATRAIDHSEIPNNRLINTLFFYSHFSIAAPVLYIAINQVLKIGDIALKNSPVYKTVISCVAYASLALSLGTHAGARATNRNRTYPAEMNPLIVLFTYFFVQQLLSQV